MPLHLALATLGPLPHAVAIVALTALIFVADFVPRVKAGLGALGFTPVVDPVVWARDPNPVDLVLRTPGLTDEQKIAICGGSFGGYAALLKRA